MNDRDRCRKTARQRELRREDPERYREYDRKPSRVFSKAVDATRRKIEAMKLVASGDAIQCRICGEKALIKLTIDHIDESGSQRNLYHRILSGKESEASKQILCYSCNAALRVLGHGEDERLDHYIRVQNEATRRAISRGTITKDDVPEITIKDARGLAGWPADHLDVDK